MVCLTSKNGYDNDPSRQQVEITPKPDAYYSTHPTLPQLTLTDFAS